MAYVNGQLPAGLLVKVADDDYGNVLPIFAAASWARLVAHVEREHGWRPRLSGGACGYRTYAQQVKIFHERYTIQAIPGRPTKKWGTTLYWLRLVSTIGQKNPATAATPGTSNHGKEAGAVDVAGISTPPKFASLRYKQFAAIAIQHGWTNTEGRSIGEPWHWVYNVRADRYAGVAQPAQPAAKPQAPMEDDDMPTAKEIVDELMGRQISVGDAGLPPAAPFAQLVADIAVHARRGVTSPQEVADAVLSTRIPNGDEGQEQPVWTVLRDARVGALRDHATAVVTQVSALTDADLAKIAQAVNDEAHRRSAR